MNTLELRNNTKEKVDELFNEMESFKVKSENVQSQMKSQWDESMTKLEDSKDSLKEIYAKISQANDEAAVELSKAFDEQWKSAEERMSKLKEIYSKALN